MNGSFIIVFLSVLLVANAYKQTLSAGETLAFRILSSGGLSYKVEGMNRGDLLCVMVGPQYCRRTIGECYCGPTNYSTEETVLFLFITNNNLFTSSVVFYGYNNTERPLPPSPIPSPTVVWIPGSPHSPSPTPDYSPTPVVPWSPSPTPTPTPTPRFPKTPPHWSSTPSPTPTPILSPSPTPTPTPRFATTPTPRWKPTPAPTSPTPYV